MKQTDEQPQRLSRGAHATRDRLLEAAEALFSERGYHAVSMRHIAERAHVNLAAANYHFGSKERLFVEALSRRIRPINARRLSDLDALVSGGRPPSLPSILDAFARAIIEESLSCPETGRRLNRLLSRAFAESDEIAQHIFRQELLHVAKRFIHAIRLAQPSLSENQAGLGLALYAGCVIHLLRWCVSPPLKDLIPDGPPLTVDDAMRALVAFGSAGFAEIVPARTAPRKRQP